MASPIKDVRTCEPGLIRDLELRDAVAIVTGTVIGSGIFLVPSSVANQLYSVSAVLLVWITGGVLTLFGALALGELGAAFPGAGGLYVYLRLAYGRPVAFLYGWGLLTLIHSGSIATLAVAFRLYLAQAIPLSQGQQKLAGILCILVLTGANCLGVRSGKGIQNIFTVAKLGALGLMIGLLFFKSHFAMLSAEFWPESPLRIHAGRFGIALIAVLWAYEGWHAVSFTAAEFRRPERDLPRGLFCGTLLVVIVYLLANIAYYLELGPIQIQQSRGVAATALHSAMGGTASFAIVALILVSIIGATNGMILTGPRVYYAMAREGLFFSAFGKVSARFRVPIWAILMQGLWAACLTLLGTFQELFTCVVFTAWIFYGLAVAAVIVLRRRYPEVERPFQVPGYPALPVMFVVAAFGIASAAVATSPWRAIVGIGLILSGLPVFPMFLSQRSNKEAGSPLG